jgi:uncharacterized protein YpuA (DUF1002 family)
MKKNLTESDIKRIVNRVINEDLQESTWEGVKGWFKGKGYYYSKYLSELEDVLEELEYKINNDRKIRKKFDEVKLKISESDMEDFQKQELEDIITQITKILNYTDILIQKELYKIYRLKK